MRLNPQVTMSALASFFLLSSCNFNPGGTSQSPGAGAHWLTPRYPDASSCVRVNLTLRDSVGKDGIADATITGSVTGPLFKDISCQVPTSSVLISAGEAGAALYVMTGESGSVQISANMDNMVGNGAYNKDQNGNTIAPFVVENLIVDTRSNSATITVTQAPSIPTNISSASIEEQLASLEPGIPKIIRVRVYDSTGKPSPGFAVNFQSLSSGISFDPVQSITDQEGYAEAVATMTAAHFADVSARVGNESLVNVKWMNFNVAVPIVLACDPAQHIENGACVSDSRSCSTDNGSGAQSYANSAWSISCTLLSCDAGFVLAGGSCAASCALNQHRDSSGSCASNSMVCAVANGTGSSTYASGAWGSCLATSCSESFELSSDASACVVSFVPPSLDGLDVWLTADRESSRNLGIPVADGDKVMTWGQFSAPSTPAAPKLSKAAINGYDLMDFTSSAGGQMLFNSFANNTGSYSVTLAYVAAQDLWGSGMSSITGSGLFSISLYFGYQGAYDAFYGLSEFRNPILHVDGNIAFVTIVADAAANTMSLYFNGVNGAWKVVYTDYAVRNSAHIKSLIEGLSIGSDRWKFAESLVYSKAIPETQVQDLHRYLKNKYYNATYAKGTANSKLTSCSDGSHMNGSGSCDPDLDTCSSDGSSSGIKAWNGVYYSCVITACLTDYQLDPATNSCAYVGLPRSGLVVRLSALYGPDLVGDPIVEWGDMIHPGGIAFVPTAASTGNLDLSIGADGLPVMTFPASTQLAWTPDPALNLDKDYTIIGVYGEDGSYSDDTCMNWQNPSNGLGVSFRGWGTRFDSATGVFGLNYDVSYADKAFSAITSDSTGGLRGYQSGRDFEIPWYRGSNSPLPIIESPSQAGLTMYIGSLSQRVCKFSEFIVYNRALSAAEMEQVRNYIILQYGAGILQGR